MLDMHLDANAPVALRRRGRRRRRAILVFSVGLRIGQTALQHDQLAGAARRQRLEDLLEVLRHALWHQ